MFKGNYKDTGRQTLCFSVSILNFELVILGA